MILGRGGPASTSFVRGALHLDRGPHRSKPRSDQEARGEPVTTSRQSAEGPRLTRRDLTDKASRAADAALNGQVIHLRPPGRDGVITVAIAREVSACLVILRR